MARIVQKFGGSSVANAERIFRVAKIITDAYAKGNEMCVVLSAQGDTTDDLIAKAEEINPNASKREMDMLLACGEQMSIALMAMAIEKLGYPVVSLCGWQVGMNTSSTHSFARIKKVRHCMPGTHGIPKGSADPFVMLRGKRNNSNFFAAARHRASLRS